MALVAWGIATHAAEAARYRVELDSRFQVQWIGILDTQSDTFTLESWIERPGLPDTWTPRASSLPIIMHAQSSDGTRFDVPDEFGTFSIGSTWAFIGPDLGAIQWNQGSAPLFYGYGYRVAWGATTSGFFSGTDYSPNELIGGARIIRSNAVTDGTLFDTMSIIRIPDPQCDLEASIDILQPTLVAGGDASEAFRVTITNKGPTNATGVELTQTSSMLPGVAITATSTSAGTFSGGVWTVGDLESGSSSSLMLTIRADAGAASGTENVPVAFAVTAVNEPDPDGTNNSASAAASIISAADTEVGVIASPAINLQSGLFFSKVTITNGNADPIPAIRLFVDGLPDDVIVYNASGTASLGSPPEILSYLLYNQSLGPSDSVTLAVEFYRPSLDPNFNPTYKIDLLPVPETPPVAADSGIDVTRNEKLGNGDHLIEIASIPGATYAVEYSPDMTTWMRVLPSITAPANRLQWIDSGPPKTESHPSATASRFYRFVLIAAP
ncbi:DUF11 domain-containing protein [Haloferula sp. A504]|uniref:DUF11 domain-containing protein n=1 Tax=Haloferula sp. A504 TaxID=3373601 RepID=UPI0031C83C15|nr:DUF11 domain-containing protein [Verrucomicrobiaceae bacterium E54]